MKKRATFGVIGLSLIAVISVVLARQKTAKRIEKPLMKKPLMAAATLLLAAQAQTQSHAATWQFKWTPQAGEKAPVVEITPLKYGKTWAYSFQEDDGGTGALTATQPLFARYEWNTAPPGVAGGAKKPFVGTAAIVLGSVGRNSASLNLEQLAELKSKGWNIINHSFRHSGVHWGDPAT